MTVAQAISSVNNTLNAAESPVLSPWFDMLAPLADHYFKEVDMALDEVQKTALGIILEKGVVGGEELMAKTRKSDSELFGAMKELIRVGVVHSNTVLYSADVVKNAYFNLKPSALGLAKDLISKE